MKNWCNRCNGSKEINNPESKWWPFGKLITCPVCNGAGEILPPVKNKKNPIDNGLTEDEQKAMDKLLGCYDIYLKLKPQHPSEMGDFVYAVHLIQGLLCKRIVRRLYPKEWPIAK